MTDSTGVAAPDQQVLITRIFDAPREAVFAAWTDPDQVAAWYGPEHFQTPREKVHIDLRVELIGPGLGEALGGGKRLVHRRGQPR